MIVTMFSREVAEKCAFPIYNFIKKGKLLFDYTAICLFVYFIDDFKCSLEIYNEYHRCSLNENIKYFV